MDEWGTCQKVTNANAKALFVPTNTSLEWSTFRTNKPGDVTLASCCVHGSQSWSSAITTTFTVPAGCSSLTIDLRGPGGGGGGAFDLGCTGDAGVAGGGGVVAGGVGDCYSGPGGIAGSDSYIKRSTTVLAQAKIGKGGDGASGGCFAGMGGAEGTTVSTGLSLVPGGGGAGGLSGLPTGWGNTDGSPGDKVTGIISVTPGEYLDIGVGLPGGGGGGRNDYPACGMDGGSGGNGYVSISW